MKYKDNKNMRGFTLIELIAVLVIMAIIALIVTPLVMNIVKKAKYSANKRSVDAYGKAVELAIATYLLDTGDYPTSLDNLTVEYSGNEVVCNIQTLNEDGSVYLSECSVKGIEVKDSNAEDGWYHYGKLNSTEITYQAYNVGDQITYNGMNFYVTEDSDSTSDRVTLLKETPLTVDEVNTYGGVGTNNNHVNMYITSDTTASYYQTATDQSGYGGMAYYTSSTCGYNGTDGCTTDYAQSEVKYVVDAWANDKFSKGALVEDRIGYVARLLTFDELITNLGFSIKEGATRYTPTEDVTPSWVYNSQRYYWAMSQYEDSASDMWAVDSYGNVEKVDVDRSHGLVRPVVTLKKSAI